MEELSSRYRDKIEQIRKQICGVIRGKEDVIDLLLTTVFSGGHVLLDDVPGVGKTTLAKALACTIRADFKRIQFTSDMMPSDILGSSVFNQKNGEFRFFPGPIFTNILLGDEINRASPRTQSALLEAMNERQVSIEGKSYHLPHPFIVIATENPIEYLGTFALPEAQLDRFTMRFSLGYPTEQEELAMLNDRWETDPLEHLSPVISCEELVEIRGTVRTIHVEQTIQEYMMKLVSATRVQNSGFSLGASPRALLDLARCAQARAFLQHRTFVTPDDITYLVPHVLSHRLIPDTKSHHSGLTSETLLTAILKQIHVPL